MSLPFTCQEVPQLPDQAFETPLGLSLPSVQPPLSLTHPLPSPSPPLSTDPLLFCLQSPTQVLPLL